jgi:hypothetical protein
VIDRQAVSAGRKSLETRAHDAAIDGDLLVFEDERKAAAAAGCRSERTRMLDARAEDTDVDDDDLVRAKTARDRQR